MTLISCDEKCIYQSDGYCKLDMTAAVTNCTDSGCMHRIQPDNSPTVLQEPQQRHEWYGLR
ncbi:MAG: hypothetical protein IJ861_08035 [Clostridia bacterium]|nr:hypothetical protein [Clostridia bacterium]